jgi:hypothetical protein
MNNDISPMYLMNLISKIEAKLWITFPSSKYKNVEFYIRKWQKKDYDSLVTKYGIVLKL